MATYKVRGTSHNVIYPYKTEKGESKQQWETYLTELEAVQRKAFIDYLQKSRRFDEVLQAATDYKIKRAADKASQLAEEVQDSEAMSYVTSEEDNTDKTYSEFVKKWLPFHARKKRLSPNTYDNYNSSINNHILPYFGSKVMSTITSEDIDDFLDYLSKKPCKGSKSYGRNPDEIPTLSSGAIKKCYNIIIAGFSTAKKWRYITEIPETTAPAEKTKKRKAWDPQQVYTTLTGIMSDRVLHLAVHIAFVCSLRAGETAGINISTLDFYDRSMWIVQEIQRVSDKALAVLPKNEIIRVFPKKVNSSQSSMIIKGPKTEGSIRKQYLTTPLLQEIKERLSEIDENKKVFGSEYHDYGLLLCHPDGSPIDPKTLGKSFKWWQSELGIEPEDQIEFQGLRKSGQMHKVRLTQNNYQLVAESSGQSAEVLMSNYNEALDSEKRTLSLMVETSFYPSAEVGSQSQTQNEELNSIIQAVQNNPELSQQIVQLLRLNAVSAT